ncbi:LIM-domain binding protein [Pisolithus microcarpus]|nr:LIM-domain binding protein [Pisolithus microcarpus]
MAPPLGFGQGCIRLLQFSGQLSSEGPEITRKKHRLQFWDDLVKDYFTSRAVMKITLWKDNQKVEAKPLEIGYSILPRFFLVTTQSGVKSMTLSLDGARERLVDQAHAVVECVSAVWTYKYTNGYTVTLRGPLTVHILLYPTTGSSPTSPQQFQSWLKIGHFQFDANIHEKFISLDAITGNRIIEPPKTPRARNNPTPTPNGASGAHRTEEDRQWEEHRVIINNASIPGEPVNAFGIPQVTMRCLEVSRRLASIVNSVGDCDPL